MNLTLSNCKLAIQSWQFRCLRRKVERQVRLAYQGHFKYDGMIMKARWSGQPLGYVRYPNGYRSTVMALGNAVEYAQMFDGKVVHTHIKN